MIWFVFLAVCLYHMRNGHENALRGASTTSCGVVEETGSTEDIWNEDKYIPDAAYLPSPPHIRVNVSAIQPQHEQLEPKHEMDESWDYDYDSSRMHKGVFKQDNLRSVKLQSDKSFNLSPTHHSSLKCGKISPVSPRNPNFFKDINGNRSPRFCSVSGNKMQGQQPPPHLLRPSTLKMHPNQRSGYLFIFLGCFI